MDEEYEIDLTRNCTSITMNMLRGLMPDWKTLIVTLKGEPDGGRPSQQQLNAFDVLRKAQTKRNHLPEPRWVDTQTHSHSHTQTHTCTQTMTPTQGSDSKDKSGKRNVTFPVREISGNLIWGLKIREISGNFK